MAGGIGRARAGAPEDTPLEIIHYNQLYNNRVYDIVYMIIIVCIIMCTILIYHTIRDLRDKAHPRRKR